MSQTTAFADDEIGRAMTALSAEVQASLALNRALMKALAATSPSLNAAAERALEDELEQARRLSSPQRVIDLIEGVREDVQDASDDLDRMSTLEYALIAAADALPEISDLQAAETAGLARG